MTNVDECRLDLDLYMGGSWSRDVWAVVASDALRVWVKCALGVGQDYV
jgi:hypothetical protein